MPDIADLIIVPAPAEAAAHDAPIRLEGVRWFSPTSRPPAPRPIPPDGPGTAFDDPRLVAYLDSLEEGELIALELEEVTESDLEAAAGLARAYSRPLVLRRGTEVT